MSELQKPKNMEDFFNNWPLYTKLKFKIFKINDDYYFIDNDELAKLNCICNPYMINTQGNIYSYCNKCNQDTHFKFTSSYMGYGSSIRFYFGKERDSNIGINFRFPDFNYDGNSFISKERILDQKYWHQINYIDCTFSCPNHHEYKMILAFENVADELWITKVGQYSSLRDIKKHDFDKYKKVISKDLLKYLKNADELNAFGYSIASFLYVRRAIELKISDFEKLSKIKPKDHAMLGERLDLVKKCFTDKLKNHIKTISKILGYGIHNLTESQCKNYYDIILNCLMVQFDEELKNANQEENLKQLSNIVSKIE